MRHLNRIFATLILLIMTIQVFALKLTLEDDINAESKKVYATISSSEGLPDESQAWLEALGASSIDEIRLIGEPDIKSNGNIYDYRITFDKAEYGSEKITLSPVIVSEFKADSGGVEAGAKMVAELESTDSGDSNFRSVVIDDDEEEEEESTEDSGSPFPTTSNGNNGSSGLGSILSASTPTSTTSNINTTTWEECAPRIDSDAELLYPQAKLIEETIEGNTVSIGQCQDYDEPLLGQRVYECPPEVSISDGIAYKTYYVVAQFNDTEYKISDCKTDETQVVEIQSTEDGCDVRDDYLRDKTFIQIKYFYESSAGIEFLTDCVDSPDGFTHFWTTASCEAIAGTVSGTVSVQQRRAYTNLAGELVFLGECESVSGSQQLVLEEICPGEYEHDVLLGSSHLYTREYFTNSDGEREYVTGCDVSTTKSILHEFDYASCDLTVNADTSRAIQSYVPFIMDEGQKIEISACVLDENNYVSIQSTYDGCDVNFDEVKQQAIQQEQLYYNYSDLTTYVTSCQDSLLAYPYQLSAYDCTAYYDETNGLVYEKKKLSFVDNAGQLIEVPSALCEIDYSNSFIASIESCDEQYEHDLVNGVSYPFSKTYYTDTLGTVHYLSSCEINDAISYIHIKNADNCSPVFDTDNELMYESYQTFINVGGLDKAITDCIADSDDSAPLNTQSEFCEGRYEHDSVNGYSIPFTRYYFFYEGEKVYTSNCAASPDITYTHVRETKDCDNLPDLTNLIAYRGYSAFFIDTFGEQQVHDCKIDLTIAYDLIATTDGCEIRHDFDNNKSLERERYYFDNDGDKEYITSCIDSTVEFSHYETDYGCNPYTDNTNQIFEQTRVAFKDASNSEQYATGCRISPTQTTGISIQEEFCSPKYQHDVDNLISYAYTKKFYINSTSDKIYLSSCEISDTITYNHIQDYDSCDLYSDTNSDLAYFQYRIVINDGAEVVIVRVCQPDYLQAYILQHSYEQCSIRHDVAGGYSVQQEKLYYNDGIQDVDITSCVDSELVYPHYASIYDCAAIVSPDSSVAYLQKRLVYVNYSGFEIPVPGEICQQIPNQTVNLEKQQCIGQYTHDNANSVSFRFTSLYYEDPATNGYVFVSTCSEDSDERIPHEIVINPDGCPAFNDTASLKRYNGLSHSFIDLGETFITDNCSHDMDNPITLYEDFEECTVRYDYINDLAIIRVAYYYEDDDKEEYVTTCRDSSSSYALYETENTCERIIDESTGLAFVQTRLAYNDESGVQYATDCRINSATEDGVDIVEEACSDRWEHDFSANQTFERTRKVYTYQGAKRVVEDCARSTSVSYSHEFSSSGCSIVNNNVGLYSTYSNRRFVTLPTGKLWFDDSCIVDYIVPYIFIENSVKTKWSSIDDFTGSENSYSNYGSFRSHFDSAMQTLTFDTFEFIVGFSAPLVIGVDEIVTKTYTNYVIPTPYLYIKVNNNNSGDDIRMKKYWYQDINEYKRVDGTTYNHVLRNSAKFEAYEI